jgi:hypothetical protein
VSNQNDALAGVCSTAEIEAVQEESELRGLRYRAAQLLVMALDAQLAVAVAEDDKERGLRIAVELTLALDELKAIQVFEKSELSRIKKIFVSASKQKSPLSTMEQN